MPYLGNTPTTQNFISGTDYFNGTGAQTAFTLTRTVNSVNDIQVVVNNVVQQPNDAYTLSGTTLTMTSAPSAGTNNVYVRYLSTTTQVITPSQNTVSWNTLDSNIKQDLGLMGKNRIINGAMTINQRQYGSTPISTDPVFTLDRWRNSANGGGAFSSTQSSVVPNGQFTNSLLLTVTTADSSIASNDYYSVNQVVEGYNIADFGWGTADAQSVTVSFWVRASVSGTYSLALCNIDFTRAYVATYTISATNTWQYITITIPGVTTGTWNTTNNQGLYVVWNIGEGSGRQTATPNTWINSYAGSTSSTVNLISTLNATFYLTGVQLEVGTQATAFSTAGGSYGAELALCQRYYWKQTGTGVNFSLITSPGYSVSTTRVNGPVIRFPVPMRASPTSTISGGGFYDGSSVVAISGNYLYQAYTPYSFSFDLGSSTLTSGRPCAYGMTNTNEYIDFSAEL